MLITRRSIMTRKEHTMEIPLTTQEFQDVIHRNVPIQSVVPSLPPELREFLMTGITPEEWDKHFYTEPEFTLEDYDQKED